MPELLQSVVLLLIGGLVTVAATWAGDLAASKRAAARLEQLDRAIAIRDRLGDKPEAAAVLEAEIVRLVAAIQASASARPKWQSFGVYVLGLVILLALGMVVTGIVGTLLGVTSSQLVAIWGTLAVSAPIIFAVELQPSFLQPFIGRFAPRSRRRR